MSDFNVKITVRSARIIRAIDALYGSQANMARETGLSMAKVNGFAAMRVSPVGAGGWTQSALDFSAALRIPPEVLWPQHLQRLTLRKSTATMEMDVAQVQQLMSDDDQERALNYKQTAALLTDGIRERELSAALKMVEGATMDELATELGVSRERARQIAMKGLRKMREKAQRLGIRTFEAVQ